MQKSYAFKTCLIQIGTHFRFCKLENKPRTLNEEFFQSQLKIRYKLFCLLFRDKELRAFYLI